MTEQFNIPGDWIWHDANGVVRLATPPDWHTVDVKDLIDVDDVILAVAEMPTVEELFVTNVNFVRGRSIEADETLDQYAVSEKNALAEALDDFQLIDLSAFELAGREWSELLVAFQGEQDALTLLQRITIPPGGIPVVVSATADTNEWAEVEGLIQAILATVQFEELQ